MSEDHSCVETSVNQEELLKHDLEMNFCSEGSNENKNCSHIEDKKILNGYVDYKENILNSNETTEYLSENSVIKIHTQDSTIQNDIIKGMKMMTLGSNNNVFLTSKSMHGQPIYLSKELPKFLQDSLNESLSRTLILENDVEKIVEFIDYESEEKLPDLTALITKDLSEPYSIYTYRYFLHNWPQLSFLAYCEDTCVGAIVCKLDQHRKNVWRGYIAMLVVEKDYRRHKIGTKLVQKAIRRMIEQGCDEVVLETEVTNKAALNLYENLGFVRDKRLLRYYLNGVDAWRLKLWLA